MNEHRTEIPLDPEVSYSYVEMGPTPNSPLWHQDIYNRSRYAFPTEQAAFRFANHERGRHPGRTIIVITNDGERFVI